jgi:hypothetical protein
MPYHPTSRQRLIPILPSAILYRRYPSVIEGGFGESAEVDGCQLEILILGESLVLAVRHMRHQPVTYPLSFSDGLVHHSLARGVGHFQLDLRRGFEVS